MHVAMIIDEERLATERRMLSRLVVGLIGEGATVTRILPDSEAMRSEESQEPDVSLAPRIDAPMRVLPWMQSSRAARLLDALERSTPDILYALGRQTWPIGLEMARLLERPLAVHVWAASLLRRLPRGRAAGQVAGYVAPTQPLVRALQARVGSDLVSRVPLGVGVPREARQILADPATAVGMAIVGGAHDLGAWEAALQGLARVIRVAPQIQALIQLQGPRAHEVWRVASRLDVLGHLSAHRDIRQYRDLITRCDLLVLPEASGAAGSLILDAMAAGMAILARADPWQEVLQPEETAVVIDGPDPGQWAAALRRGVEEPESLRAIGKRAHGLVASDYRSADQVQGLLRTFDRILSGDVYAFDGSRSPR